MYDVCGHLKACPHLFPKQATYPKTGDFVAENGDKVAFVSGNKVACLGIRMVANCHQINDEQCWVVIASNLVTETTNKLRTFFSNL